MDLLNQAADSTGSDDPLASSGDALVALGYYYMTGEDNTAAQNTTKAMEYFKRAADLGVTMGQYHWSLLRLGISPYVPEGDAVDDMRTDANCSQGLKGMREVALRGQWISKTLPWSTEIAYSSWVAGKTDRALVHYMLTAELGSPTSQINAAFLLRKGFGTSYDSPPFSRRLSLFMRDHVISGQTSMAWHGLELQISKKLFDRIDPWRTTPDLTKCEQESVPADLHGPYTDSAAANSLFANENRHLGMVAAKRLATLSDRQGVGEASRMLAECKWNLRVGAGPAPLQGGRAWSTEKGSDFGDSEAR